jgi:hypothetical protein
MSLAELWLTGGVLRPRRKAGAENAPLNNSSSICGNADRPVAATVLCPTSAAAECIADAGAGDGTGIDNRPAALN